MSASENPNMQIVPDPSRQLPPASLFLAPKVAGAAEWVGRTQVRIGEALGAAYRSARDGSVSFMHELRDRSVKIKEENPTALLAGIAGTAFAFGVVARVWKSRR